MSLRRSKIPKFIPIISLLILLVLGPIVFSLLQNASPAEAAWVDDNFSYRNAIPITSHTAAESNVYISATIDTSASGQFQSDCGDLRFTTVGGDILPYYIVSGCVSASTVVHVFFKSMPAGAQTIYYYYGNPSAANGFSSSDFATQATAYAIGSVGSQEKGGAPIAYWKFDDGTGTNAQDSSPNNNDGTITGATWQTEDQCISGKCLKFDGSTSNVSLANGGNISYTNGFSVSLWFYGNSFSSPDAPELFRVRVTGTNKWISLRVAYNNELEFMVRGVDNDIEINSPNSYISENKWYHITAVYNPSGTTMLFINGVQMSDTSTANAGTITLNGATTIGQGFNGWEWNGRIDEVKVYPYARTAAQIKSDFKSRGVAKGTSVGLGSKISDLGSLSNGLIGYWKMDEVSGAGSTLADSSGNSNTGTAVLWGGGNTSTDSAHVAGKFGNSFSFDGGDDAITVPDVTSLRFTSTTGVSVSAWVKMNVTNQNDDIVSKMSGNNGIQLRRNSSGKFTWSIGNGTTSATSTNTSTLSTGVWYHVTGTFDRNTLYVYVNGVQEGSNTISGFSDDTAQLVIGNENQLSNNAYWDGTIDEVRIYNRALSPREVRDLYNWAPGPMGYWNLDESTAGNANDSSGNGYTGTNTSTAIVNGKFDKARDFNGSTSILTTNMTTNFPTSFTVEAWANADVTDATYDTIISKFTSSPSYNGFFLRHINGSMQAAVYSGGTGYTSTTPVTLGLWTHWAMSYDGTTIKLYKNGILSDSDPGTLGTNTSALIIGGNYGGATEPFDGKIDDVRLYNYARTQKQIVEDMNAGHPVGGSPVGSQVGYWKMDEGYGSTVSNSGNGVNLNGTITGATWNNNGKFSKALSFDGSGDTVALAGTSALNIVNNLTLSAWINPSTLTQASNPEIIAKSGGAYFYRMRFLDGGKVRFNTYGASDTVLESTATLVASTWTHIVMTYDGQNKKIYLNGKLDSSEATTGDMTSEAATTLNIGSLIGGSESFNGLIDEVKIYNSALTSDEIQIDYNRGQAMVLGTTGDASSSAGALYCQPGSSDTCNPPVGEWNFNENGGTSTYDTSGNGNTGTITGATWNAIGKTGSALQFTNDGDGVDAGSGSSLAISGNMTLEAWVYPTTTTGWAGIISRWGNSWAWALDTTSHRNAFYINGWLYSTSNVPANQWSHVAVVYNDTTDLVYFFLNGKPDGSSSQTVNQGSTGPVTIGQWGNNYYFKGKIDQVRVFNYARTAAQIALDYNQGKPVGHWKMDECQGVSVFDSSGNNNTGTITIGATGTQTAVGTCTTSGTAWYNGVAGKFNSSLNFDGTDDYVDLGDPSADDVTGAITLSAWIKPTTVTGSSQKIVGDENSAWCGYPCGGYSLYITSGGYLNFSFGDNATGGNTGNWDVVVSDTVLTAGSWQHVVGIWDGTTGSNGMKVYVNGILKGQATAVQTRIDHGTPNTVIGAENDSAGTWRNYFSGQIDDVRIYNYALTASQVKSIYNGGAAVKFGPVTGSP